jgi:hypothetical protein
MIPAVDLPALRFTLAEALGTHELGLASSRRAAHRRDTGSVAEERSSVSDCCSHYKNPVWLGRDCDMAD